MRPSTNHPKEKLKGNTGLGCSVLLFKLSLRSQSCTCVGRWENCCHLVAEKTQHTTMGGVPYGTPLQYSCLENPMDGGAWWAAVHGVAESRTRLSDFTFTFPFMHWRRKWQPTPVFSPGESQGWGSLVGSRLWGRTESDTTEAT